VGTVKENHSSFLLDTHVLLWWLFNEPKLSDRAYSIIEQPDNTIFVSSASGWEIATKYRLGKLRHAAEAARNLPALLRKAHMDVLPITLEHALAAGTLPGPHRDPFDRMLIAQAQLEDMVLVTSDAVFEDYNVAVLW